MPPGESPTGGAAAPGRSDLAVDVGVGGGKVGVALDGVEEATDEGVAQRNFSSRSGKLAPLAGVLTRPTCDPESSFFAVRGGARNAAGTSARGVFGGAVEVEEESVAPPAGVLGRRSAGSETSCGRGADAEGVEAAVGIPRDRPGSSLSRTDLLMRRMVGSLLAGAKGIAFTSHEFGSRTMRAFTSSKRELIRCSFHISPTDRSV